MYSNGLPYSNGLVELRSNPIYTTTDTAGYFRFNNVPVGSHTISAIQNNTVLASVRIEIRRTSQTEDIGISKLGAGNFVVQISVAVIQINISLRIEGEELDLLDVVVTRREGDEEPLDFRTPSQPETEPDIEPEPDGPSEPGIPVTPEPDNPPGPDNPPVTPVPPGEPNPPSDRDDDPNIVASDDYGSGSWWTVGTSVDVFSPRSGNAGVKTINGETVIAPGASGRYTFKIENPDSKTVQYVIRLSESDQNDPKLPIRYRLEAGLPGDGYTGDSSWKTAESISMGEITIGPGKTHYYTLDWKWATTGDDIDTRIGLQEPGPIYVLNIVINAWYR